MGKGDIGCLAGKTLLRKTVAVGSDCREVPPDILDLHRDVKIAADIMYVNQNSVFSDGSA